MEFSTIYPNMQWGDHIASVCISGPKIRHRRWWFGVVVHTWGLRIGVGPREICVHWK